MANQAIIIRHQSSVGQSSAVLIEFGTQVQKVYVTSITADVLVEFDGTANADSFRVVAGQHPAEFDFRGCNVKTVSLLGSGGTANVYVMGVVS